MEGLRVLRLSHGINLAQAQGTTKTLNPRSSSFSDAAMQRRTPSWMRSICGQWQMRASNQCHSLPSSLHLKSQRKVLPQFSGGQKRYPESCLYVHSDEAAA
ncbi:hypothetical protein MIND_01162900 [Mycena indigotica]|uniref:Uncharacterized protein n=1 Tax=Mycena indigotica TaxID=2126181 RepID=A0A8H6VSV4_9AGAR|nr:uncharacterized protein MIND_01162900 [Mycena indigotica]KAF7292649.1 hypothetical protein MIND_01162900 [Mycena indigotica]